MTQTVMEQKIVVVYVVKVAANHDFGTVSAVSIRCRTLSVSEHWLVKVAFIFRFDYDRSTVFYFLYPGLTWKSPYNIEYIKKAQILIWSIKKNILKTYVMFLCICQKFYIGKYVFVDIKSYSTAIMRYIQPNTTSLQVDKQ